LIFVFILSFNMLNLQFIASPFVGMVSIIAAAIPNILKAALIFIVGWIIASFVRMFIMRTGNSPRTGRWLSKIRAAEPGQDTYATVNKAAQATFYLILLFFLPGALHALQIPAISEPLSDMLSKFFHFVPNLFGAIITLAIGWFIAKLVRDIVTNFLQKLFPYK
jgi:uncharacterized membrane protein YqaE (UPF0057 family)